MAPAIGLDGTIYFGTKYDEKGDKIYALDPTTTKCKWVVETETKQESVSPPAIGTNGTVYFTGAHRITLPYYNILYAINPANGERKELLKIETEQEKASWNSSAPAIS